VNPQQPGGAYGYVDMGGWVGGQAEYVLVPYADFNLLRFPDKARAMEKITDLTMLSDILPTGFHGATTAGVTVGSTVYIAGAGPVGLAAAASAQILGAAVVIVGDRNPDRLRHAKSVGFETIDISKHDSLAEQIADLLGEPYVDAAVDAVGFEASGHGAKNEAAPAAVLNDLMDVTFVAGGVGIPGLYVVEDPGAPNEDAKKGMLKLRIGKGWSKSLHFHTGQAPVLQYNRQLMQAILHDRLPIAKIVNATVVSLDQAPQGYADFDKGAAKKYVLDPHGLVKKAA
jgi:glutathione-independent formaldehyde dehydrogenase